MSSCDVSELDKAVSSWIVYTTIHISLKSVVTRLWAERLIITIPAQTAGPPQFHPTRFSGSYIPPSKTQLFHKSAAIPARQDRVSLGRRHHPPASTGRGGVIKRQLSLLEPSRPSGAFPRDFLRFTDSKCRHFSQRWTQLPRLFEPKWNHP